jgi:hypothetical protein
MLLWPAFASAEEKWKANIEKVCEREWSDEPILRKQCIVQQAEHATTFANYYESISDPSIRKFLRSCWEKWTEDGLTDWDLVDICIKPHPYDRVYRFPE